METLMPLVQVRDRRQMTIPADIAQKLNLKAGDYLEAHAEGGKIILAVKEVQDRVQKRSIMDIIGTAKGAYGSTEAIDAMIAEGRNDSR